MKKRFAHAVHEASEARALFVLLVALVLRARYRTHHGIQTVAKWLYVHELYIFPPVAFIADYAWMKRIFPEHPFTEMAVLATAFMSMTMTLFLLRPRKWKMAAHWVK
jgi:uncharacterized membrane protein YhdT